jgi:hypothetical protein
VTTTAGGATGFSTGAAGGAGAGGAAGLAAGGATTTGFSGAETAGLGATTVGFSGGAGAAGALVTTGGIAGRAGGTVTGLAAGAGCCCCCSRSLRSFSTSPGLEILERSIFGLISGGAAFSLDTELDLAEKCLRIFSASSSSMELEWVFFSVIPISSNASRIALLLTSSSLARSLIRIFIRSVFPPG